MQNKQKLFGVNLILHPKYLAFLDQFLYHYTFAEKLYGKHVDLHILLSYCRREEDITRFKEILAEHKKLNIKYFIESERYTCGGSRNYLFKKSNFAWNVFTDVDIKLHPLYFKNLSTYIKDIEPDIYGIAGGIGCWGGTAWGIYEYLTELKAYYGKTSRKICNYLLCSIVWPEKNIKDKLHFLENYDISYFQGYNQILNIKVMTELSGYDAKFFGAEDREIAARILSKGYKIKLVPNIFVYHFFGMSLRDITIRKYGHGYYSAKFRRKYTYLGKYERGIKKWVKILYTLVNVPVEYRSVIGYIYLCVSTLAYFIGSVTFNLEYHFGIKLFSIMDSKSKSTLIAFNYSNLSYANEKNKNINRDINAQ